MASKPKNNSKNEARDLCQTPDYAVEPLLPYLPADACLWEPAAGEGLLVGHLERAGYSVVSGDILTGQDYFQSEPEGYDIQVTNPPFSVKYEWLKRAYALGKPFALLMPADALFAGTKAAPLFERYGVEILLPYQRINFKMPNIGWGTEEKSSSATFHTAWFTWGLKIGREITRVHLLKGKARERAITQGLVDARFPLLERIAA